MSNNCINREGHTDIKRAILCAVASEGVSDEGITKERDYGGKCNDAGGAAG